MSEQFVYSVGHANYDNTTIVLSVGPSFVALTGRQVDDLVSKLSAAKLALDCLPSFPHVSHEENDAIR